MLRINYIRNNPLNFKSISHLDQKEAIQLLNQMNAASSIKPKGKQQTYVVKNGNMVKIQNQEYSYVAKENKMMNQVILPLQIQEKNYFSGNMYDKDHVINNDRQDRNKQQLTDRNISWINQFRNVNYQQNDRLKDQICRITYEKLALQGYNKTLIDENSKKDEIINQLRLQLDIKSNPNHGNHVFGVHNPNQVPQNQSQSKTISTNSHQTFSFHTSQVGPASQYPLNQGNQIIQNNHWGGINQNKTFQPLPHNINTFRNNH